jgi:ubiquitin C-terminal hydrolase
MAIDENSVLKAIGDFDRKCSTSGQTTSKIVVYTTKLPNGKTGLTCSLEKDLPFWQKARRFFGAKEFLMSTIQEVVRVATEKQHLSEPQKSSLRNFILQTTEHKDLDKMKAVFSSVFPKPSASVPGVSHFSMKTAPPSTLSRPQMSSSMPSQPKQPELPIQKTGQTPSTAIPRQSRKSVLPPFPRTSQQTTTPHPPLPSGQQIQGSQTKLPSQGMSSSSSSTTPPQPQASLQPQPQKSVGQPTAFQNPKQSAPPPQPLQTPPLPTSSSSSAMPSSSSTVAPTWPVASKDVNPANTLECDPVKALGLENPGHHCYFNASLKMLWASAGFRMLLDDAIKKGNAHVATSLRTLFKEISKVVQNSQFKKVNFVSTDYLKTLKDSLRTVRQAMQSLKDIFPQIRKLLDSDILENLQNTRSELDADELCAALIVAVFLAATPEKSQVPFFKVADHIERTKSNPSQRTTLVSKPQDGTIPDLQDVFIPSLDGSKPSIESPTIRLEVPMESQSVAKTFTIQDYFNGYQEMEMFDVESVVKHEKNKSLFFPEVSGTPSPTQVQGTVANCKAKWGQGQKLKQDEDLRVQVTRRHPIVSDEVQHTPPCLIVTAARQTPDPEKKSTREVSFPYTLTVPVQNSEGNKLQDVTYVMKAVVVHKGKNFTFGHYYTFIPDPSSKKRTDGMPERWTKHNDETVSQVSANNLDNEILNMKKNGYVYIYDRVDPPILKSHGIV